MRTASREEIIHVLGELDDLTISRVEGLGASLADVQFAREWLHSSTIERRQRSPSPIVAKVLELIQDEEIDAAYEP